MTFSTVRTTSRLLFLAATLVAGFAFAPSAHAGVILRSPPSLGLVGYWSMNEGTSTVVHDFSGKGNHGTTTNIAEPPTSTSGWANGKLGKAITFDGQNDYVDVPNSAPLNLTGPMTVSLWFRLSGAPSFEYASPLMKTSYSGWIDGYGIYLSDDAHLGSTKSIAFFAGPNWPTAGYIAFDYTSDFQWHHVVGVYDGTRIKLYLDGVKGTDKDQSGALPTTTDDLLIGTGKGGLYFPGLIDEVRIYNYALSTSSIHTLYKSGAVTRKTPSNRGLVGYWSMDEGTSTVVHDFSGNRNNGSTTGSSAATWTNGKRGKALSFDGTDDTLGITDTDSLDVGSQFAYFAWVYPRSTSVIRQILTKGDDSFENYEMLLIDGRIHSAINWSDGRLTHESISTIQVNRWSHLGVVYDGTNLSVYIDSTLDNTYAESGKTSIPTNTALTIGSESGGGSRFFDGLIDEVRIYNRALSPDEIKALYQAKAAVLNSSQNTRVTDGLVGMWSFNGQDMGTTSARDSSGNGNTGWLINGPAKVAGKVGQALSFDGADDLVNLGISTAVGQLTGNLTVSAWIKPLTFAGIGRIVGASRLTSDNGFAFGIDNTLLRFTTFGVKDYLSSTVTLRANSWQHVVAVMNSTDVTFHVDGIQKDTVTNGVGGNPNADDNIFIGADTGVGGSEPAELFNGSIDEVRIYNRALSPDEVKRLYNMGR